MVPASVFHGIACGVYPERSRRVTHADALVSIPTFIVETCTFGNSVRLPLSIHDSVKMVGDADANNSAPKNSTSIS